MNTDPYRPQIDFHFEGANHEVESGVKFRKLNSRNPYFLG